MKFLKEIYNLPENVTDMHNLIFLIYLVFGLFVNVLVGTTPEFWLAYLIPGIFTIYFYIIKTSKGKKKFDKINNFISYISFIGIISSVFYFLFGLGKLHSWQDLVSTISYLLTFAFYLYWLVVFFVKEDKNKKFFNKENGNSTFCNIFLISYIGINLLYFLTITLESGIDMYWGINIISSLIYMSMFILRIRYIYLYQQHISERREYYV